MLILEEGLHPFGIPANPYLLFNPLLTSVNIYISRNGSAIGQFEIPELIEAISSGIVLPSDLAWHRGLEGLGEVREIVPPLLPLISSGVIPDHREVAAK